MNDELKHYIEIHTAMDIVAQYFDLDADTEGDIFVSFLEKSISFFHKEKEEKE